MKLLVSTKKTQGQRSTDFCWLAEGELVYEGLKCDRGHVDDDCGCRRALIGMETQRASTTFCVKDLPFTRTEVRALLKATLLRGGWGSFPVKVLNEAVDQMIGWAQPFDVDTVVEYRDGVVQARALIS